MSVRKFKCLDSFSIEDKFIMLEGNVYEAKPINSGYCLAFEYGSMNFTDSLFGQTIEAWIESGDIIEV